MPEVMLCATEFQISVRPVAADKTGLRCGGRPTPLGVPGSLPCCKFQFIVLFGFEICRTFGATAAAGRLGFSRGLRPQARFGAQPPKAALSAEMKLAQKLVPKSQFL